MMAQTKESIGKSTSERLQEALTALTPNQLRFVVALLDCKSKKEAAEAVGLEPNTVYGWNGNIDQAYELFRLYRTEAALEIGKNALVKAMMVKVKALDSDDEGIRQRAATEIIEWQTGKAVQKQQISGDDGGPITIRVVYDEPDSTSAEAAS
jgi:hypothetical protein